MGLAWAAAGAKISTENDKGQATGANNLYENNVFKGIVIQSDPSYVFPRNSTAYGLTISWFDGGTGSVFRNNVFESNDRSLNIGDTDSYGRSAEDITFIGNTVRKSTEGEVRPYSGVVAGDWGTHVENIRLFDMHYQNGATADLNFRSPSVQIFTGWVLNVTVSDGQGSPVSGAAVSLYDSNSHLVYGGISDGQGNIDGIYVLTTSYGFSGQQGLPTANSLGPFSIFVTSGSKHATQAVTLLGDTSLSIQLS